MSARDGAAADGWSDWEEDSETPTVQPLEPAPPTYPPLATHASPEPPLKPPPAVKHLQLSHSSGKVHEEKWKVRRPRRVAAANIQI